MNWNFTCARRKKTCVFFSPYFCLTCVLLEMPEFEKKEHVNDIYKMSVWNDYAALTEQRCKCFFGTTKKWIVGIYFFVHNRNLIISNNSFAGMRKNRNTYIICHHIVPKTTPVIYICGVVLETFSLAT